jgi:predicted nucleotidyltransferase
MKHNDFILNRFAADPRVVLAVLFGSAKEGTVRPGSDADRVAAFSSLVARQYEDDMLHATAAQAA